MTTVLDIARKSISVLKYRLTNYSKPQCFGHKGFRLGYRGAGFFSDLGIQGFGFATECDVLQGT